MRLAGRRILIFGDSLSHHGTDSAPQIWDATPRGSASSSAPGTLLAWKLLDAGASAVRVDAKVGRSAYNFFTSREPWQQLLASDQAWQPDLVLVLLGTNDLGLGASPDQAAFRRLRAAFGGAEVWAVGPPSFASATRNAQAVTVYKTLQNVFGSQVIDLRPLTVDLTVNGRTRDGVHFQASGAELVASRLMALIAAGDQGAAPSALPLAPSAPSAPRPWGFILLSFAATIAVGSVVLWTLSPPAE